MDDCIRQCLIERELDGFFFSTGTMHLLDQLHNALHHRIHAIFVASQSNAQLQDQLVGLEVAG